jgi:hypothetical protein
MRKVAGQLSVASCQLPVVSCQLSFASFHLSVVSCQLLEGSLQFLSNQKPTRIVLKLFYKGI